MEYQETYIKTNGIKLHVVLAGPENGKPVVLLHGFPEFWYGWRQQIPALVEAGYRVIVPDQRGYNLSDKPKGANAYRMRFLVQDILGLMDALGYDKVHLIGHDWGAVVAWSFAISYPERLHKLGILNVPHSAVMLRFLRRNLEQMLRSWYILFFQIPWLPEYLLRMNDWGNLVRLLLVGKPGSFTEEDLIKYKTAWSQPGELTAMLNWYRTMLRRRPNSSRDVRVKVPTLMIWGKKDTALSHRMAQPSIEYCDDGKLVFIEEATHWVQHDASEEINRLLLEFIKG